MCESRPPTIPPTSPTPRSSPSRTPRTGPPKRPRGASNWKSPPGWPPASPGAAPPAGPRAEPVILGKRPDIERFLKSPTNDVRAALIYGRDLGVVRERGHELAARIAKDP